jgi:hypothetical protein
MPSVRMLAGCSAGVPCRFRMNTPSGPYSLSRSHEAFEIAPQVKQRVFDGAETLAK